MALTVLKNANLALSFFLELCVLIALGYWGFQPGQGTITKIGLGIGTPIVAVVVWALFGAPKSGWRLQGLWLLILRVIFFGSAAIALFTVDQRVLGMVFALVFVLNCTLIYMLEQ